MTNTTIVELKRMARRHNRKTHIGVAQSKLALQRDISAKEADDSALDMGSYTPYRRAYQSANRAPKRAEASSTHSSAGPRPSSAKIPKPKRKPPKPPKPPPTTAGPAYNTRNRKKKGRRKR
jgi:hypothetical protein